MMRCVFNFVIWVSCSVLLLFRFGVNAGSGGLSKLGKNSYNVHVHRKNFTVEWHHKKQLECHPRHFNSSEDFTNTARCHITWKRDGNLCNNINGTKYLIHSRMGQKKTTIAAKINCTTGLYICEYFVQVFGSAPELVCHFPSKLEVLGGQPFTLFCEAFGNTPSTIIWKKDGQVLSSSDLFRVQEGNLTVYKMTGEHAGTYIAEAKNMFGFSAGHLIKIYLKGICFEKSLPPVTIARRGHNVTLRCHVQGQNSTSVMVKWSKDGATCICSNSTQRARCYFTKNGTLELYDINDINEGLYTCTAQSDTNEISSSTKILIHRPVRFTRFPPSKLVVDEGQTVRLECVATGSLAPTVSWLGHGMDIRKKSNWHKISQGVVESQIEESDEGIFTCQAENHWSTVNKTVYIKVHTSPKKLTLWLKHLTNGRKVTVGWRVKSDGGHPIIAYILKYGTREDALIHKQHLELRIPGRMHSFTLHLQPLKHYWLMVWAVNILGPGDVATIKFDTDKVSTVRDPIISEAGQTQASIYPDVTKSKTRPSVASWVMVLVGSFILMCGVLTIILLASQCRAQCSKTNNFGNLFDSNSSSLNSISGTQNDFVTNSTPTPSTCGRTTFFTNPLFQESPSSTTQASLVWDSYDFPTPLSQHDGNSTL